MLLLEDGVQLALNIDGGIPWNGFATSLMCAAEHSHVEVLRFIIDNPPASWDQDIADTSLIACATADDEYASRLLTKGAKPVVVERLIGNADPLLRSALGVACLRANVAMVTLLLKANATLVRATVATHSVMYGRNSANRMLEYALQVPSYRDLLTPKLPLWRKEEDARRVAITRLLLAAGATTNHELWNHELYVRARLPEGTAASALAEAR